MRDRVLNSLAGLAVLAAGLAIAGAAEARLDIVIDKRSQSMSVSIDGMEQYSWPVSTGRAGYSTPSGSFTPFRMEEEHYSKEWDDAPMPHSIFFTAKGHAIHGSLETKRLGSPASHGCVRLAPENAAILYGLVETEGLPNTRVVVTGSEPGKARVAKQEKPRRVVPRQAQPEWGPDEYGAYDGYDEYYDPPPWAYDEPWEYPPDYGWDIW
jgi:hypothetical protein